MNVRSAGHWFIYLSILFIFYFYFPCPVNAATAGEPAALEQGIIQYKAENYEEALVIFQKAKAVQGSSSIASYYLGLTYKQIGNYSEAVNQFKDAINLTPSVLDAYQELIEMLYNRNELGEAHEWITKAETLKIKPANIAFLKGLILAKEENNSEAIDAFKQAEQADSSLAQSADFQIALLQTKSRKLKGARESLKALVRIDPTSEVASFAREYEKAIAATIEAYRPLRLTIGAAWQYDTNVVSKPSSTVGIEAVDQVSGKKDAAISNTARIDYVPLLEGPWNFAAQYNFYSNNYFDAPSTNFDVMSHTLSLTPGYSIRNGEITVPVSYNEVWLNYREYMSVVSVKPALNIMIFPGHIAQFSAGYGNRYMQQKYAPGSDPNENRSGNLYNLSVGYLYPFSGGRGIFNLRYEYSWEDTVGLNWANYGSRITASFLVPVVDKLNLMISGDVFLQQYTHINDVSGTGTPGYPDTPSKRKDTVFLGSAGLTYQLFKSVNLNATFSHTKNSSNFKIYDYVRELYSVGLEYSF